MGSSHSVVCSCSDTPRPTVFEPDLTGGTCAFAAFLAWAISVRLRFCSMLAQAGSLHSAVRSCYNTPRPTIFEPDLTGGTGLGSSHSVVRSCSDTPEPTIFEPDLTGGTGWVPCILLCIHVSLCTHVSVFPNQSSLSLISLVAQVWVPRMLVLSLIGIS